MNGRRHAGRALCVIIGRAGSKGLPGKNAMPIAGRPMIAHAIDHARASSLISRTVVSTDGIEIAVAARAMNVEVIQRPPELAGDSATVDAAVRHAVETADPAAEHDVIVILYANVPVRPAGLIDRAVRTLRETGADSVQSYCDVGKHHPYWMVRLDNAGRVSAYMPNTVYRRQDLPELLIPDGGVIAVTRESLFTVIEGQPHAFLGGDRRGVRTKPGEVVDVDSPIDFAVAEATILAMAQAGTRQE